MNFDIIFTTSTEGLKIFQKDLYTINRKYKLIKHIFILVIIFSATLLIIA